jgi:serine/threonine protein phosphatase 1
MTQDRTATGGGPIRVSATDWIAAPILLPAGTREFAVGDAHGYLDLLEALLARMGAEAGGEGNLTFLGDLADRGPRGIGCFRLACRPAAELGFASKTMLEGNHEMILLSVLAALPEAVDLWLMNGGRSVLEELGIDPYAFEGMPRERAASVLRASLDADVLELVEGAESHRKAGNLLFVHAGLNPEVPLDEWFSTRERLPRRMYEDHWAWIRYPFLGHEGAFEGGRIVVHGHTPEDSVMSWKGMPKSHAHRLDGSRLGLDGGSFGTGRVAGAEFRDGCYRVFTAVDPCFVRTW